MHLKIRVNLNIRKRCQIQTTGRIFSLGVCLVTALMQLGRGSPNAPLLPHSCVSFLIRMSAVSKKILHISQSLASFLNLSIGVKMSQQLLWSTQIQTSTTHLFHVKQQTSIRSLQFSLVSIQGLILTSNLVRKSSHSVFRHKTRNYSHTFVQ